MESVELTDETGQVVPYDFFEDGDCTLVSVCPLPGNGDVNLDGMCFRRIGRWS